MSFNRIKSLGFNNKLYQSLNSEEQEVYRSLVRNWDFYDGYHWEEMPETDAPETTENYCRLFVNKFVAFELGKSFNINTSKAMKNKVVIGNEPKEGEDGTEETSTSVNSVQFLNDVWSNNKKGLLLTELGQSKSITGDSWVKVTFEEEGTFDDPFGEYPNGRINIEVVPTINSYPQFNAHNKNKLDSFTFKYVVEEEVAKGILGINKKVDALYEQIWTKDRLETYRNGELLPEDSMDLKYGVIPFVQIKNLPVVGRVRGLSDLEDVIPLNTEFNLKKSDISEILDYYASPITVVFGAKIGNLEKGANKVWGGLSKDARVEHLELNGELGASTTYLDNTKTSMCDIAGIPKATISGSNAVSNTSGVALQYQNLPLIEKTNMKRESTKEGLVLINKLILLIGVKEDLINIPEGVSSKDFYYNEVEITDTLPKDILLELQQIQIELGLKLEKRENAMKRLGKTDIETLMKEIDEEVKKDPNNPLNNLRNNLDGGNLNSGFGNGDTKGEVVNTALNGKNTNEAVLD